MTTVRSPGTLVSAEHFALALEAAEMGTWEWRVADGRVFWSASLERIHGIPEGSFGGTFEAYQSDIHPDDRTWVLETIEHSVRDRVPHRLEYRIVLPDGQVRWLQARGQLLVDDQGQPERLIGVCMDVTAQRERDAAWTETLSWRRHAEAELADKHRLALLTRDVSLAITQIAEKPQMLQQCAQACVDHLGAAFARIWTYHEPEQVLELRASAGMYTHLDGPHGRVPLGQFKIGLIAEERMPHVTNSVIEDPRVGDQEWARKEGMVSFAGYPLVFGGRLIGVLAMFARQPLTDADFDALATVANAIAVGIARARADMAIRQSEELYRERAEELAQLATALQRSNQDLDQFAYVASHDLKAPLRGIANLSQWLEEDLGAAVTPKAREHLVLMRSRVRRLDALIDGILEYSRAGRTSEPAEAVPVGRLLADVIDLLQISDRAQLEIPSDLPVIRTERAPLQQVFLNLVGNAVKHGAAAAGEPHVRIGWGRAADGYEFTVSDNGPGIAPAFHERIWGIFQTLQPRDKVEGTGIGLALVKKIVEGRGGRVWIDSAEGTGTTFGFTWPESEGEQA